MNGQVNKLVITKKNPAAKIGVRCRIKISLRALVERCQYRTILSIITQILRISSINDKKWSFLGLGVDV